MGLLGSEEPKKVEVIGPPIVLKNIVIVLSEPHNKTSDVAIEEVGGQKVLQQGTLFLESFKKILLDRIGSSDIEHETKAILLQNVEDDCLFCNFAGRNFLNDTNAVAYLRQCSNNDDIPK